MMFDAVFQYILITYLLSFIGAGLYRLFNRGNFNAQLQKRFLLGILALSLSLPFLIDKISGNIQGTTYQACYHDHPIPEVLFTQYCPDSGTEMQMCIEIAQESEHFCSCPKVSRENLLLYKANPTYDFLLKYKSAGKTVLYFVVFVVFVMLFVRILFLLNLVRTSSKETIYVKGKPYILLYPKGKNQIVCSFRLHKSFIVWQRYLDFLPASERQAVLWHEVSHLEQKDTWVKMFLQLLQGIWLLNPAYYFIMREFERINEFIADELAVTRVESVQQYASLLLKLKTKKELPLTHAFANKKTSQLKRRVQYLLHPQRKSFILQTVVVVAFSFIVSLALSGTAFYTMPGISKQVDKVKLYEHLLKEKRQTGKSVFCKNCISKAAFAE
ncbi:MAG: hypothetical protein IPM47_08180 [Sphingobacteriales bacterium]|nr:MAG: hypothetical protein IPM47_08180 [Sphingobacteriales bacterium]